DYYPFGSKMPNRNIVGDYRYGYQGQEVDPETGKEAFQLRLWDGRIGRWLTTDPMHEFSSPYLGMGNNPISKIDPTGGSTDDWVKRADGSIYWDPNANSQATTKAGETWLGTSITFAFNSFIDGAIWDGPGGQTPAGDKLTSYITLQGQENANGELTGISAISTSMVGPTPVGTGRNFYSGEGGSNNVFSYSNSSNSFNLNFEQHASVSPIEEFGLNVMGFQIVDVAQKLNISVQNGNLSYSAYTNVFPSATLSVDGIKLLHYRQPSFLQTHTARPIYKRAAEWLGTGFHYQTLDFSYYPSKFYKRN
ncbi:MAG: RHS repeat-associated core domain-containing protein, partial [Polaribacter sp.]